MIRFRLFHRGKRWEDPEKVFTGASHTAFVVFLRTSLLRAAVPPRYPSAAVESPERRCFCIDVTCDNLLDAVKQTVEEESARLIKRRDAELTINLREITFEEQQLAAKAGRFECEQ